MADKTLQKGVDAQAVSEPALEGPIADAERVTAKDALGVLEAAAAEQADAGKGTLTLAGQTVDPEQAYKNLEEALKLVKNYFGGKLKIDLSDLQFQKFHGDMVGESTETATLIDPIMLMHPAMRLAHIIAHELAHDNKKILNEGLVESYVHLWFGEDGAEGVYDAAVENFKEFAKRFDAGGNIEAGTKRAYEFYFSGQYEKLFEEYEENYINTRGSDDEKDAAYDLFGKVFPELKYSATSETAGHMVQKELGKDEPVYDDGAGMG